MLIRPVQAVFVIVQIGEQKHRCQLISLSEGKLELKCDEYFEKNSHVEFFTKHFRGKAIIDLIHFAKAHFIYELSIDQIQFQPGMLFSARL